jgi:dTDP-glucose pyrophosphorylase
MKKKYENLFVNKDEAILSVLKKMDKTGRKLLIVTNEFKFISIVSIGDIQRAIIKGCNISESIENILRKDILYAKEGDDLENVKEQMLIRRNEIMPIIASDGEIIDVIFWEEILEKGSLENNNVEINLPVIIMAGGEGTRLKPLTNVLPKPLIPLKDKTILEEIIDRFIKFGCTQYYISLNYKAEMIQFYMEKQNYKDIVINYLKEERPLGTAGSLFMIREKIKSTFIITNCDILIDEDYNSILEYHRNNENKMTIVAALKHHTIPYGTLTTGTNGLLKKINEKPEELYKINTGFYVMEPCVLSEIPENTFYDITTLIDKLIQNNIRVGVFPVKESSWIDIGNWDEYYKYIIKN